MWSPTINNDPVWEVVNGKGGWTDDSRGAFVPSRRRCVLPATGGEAAAVGVPGAMGAVERLGPNGDSDV